MQELIRDLVPGGDFLDHLTVVRRQPEQLRLENLDRLAAEDARDKIFGPTSSIELRRERLDWYASGFLRVTAACVLLVVGTWLLLQVLFIWT